MSLNSLSASNHVPFFPPGIASHKTSSSFTRPQNVKDCKKLSKKRFCKALSMNSNKSMSTSSPNIRICISSSDQILSIPRHNCDMGLSDYNSFRATPLPQYYSPDSLERNRTLFEQLDHNYKTRSLDRTSAIGRSLDRIPNKVKSKTVMNFMPDKPFYPPSKYPNIYDKTNSNLQRFLEARQQYKTPESRKSVRIMNRNKSQNTRPTNLSMKYSKIGGSVPNLSIKNLKDIPKNSSKSKSKKQNDNCKEKVKDLVQMTNDQTDYSSDMGLYRYSDKLDLQNEFDTYVPNQMSTSYFYPKPIPNQFNYDYTNKMAQSLYNESSLAAKIHTGSLERASRDNICIANNENKLEVTDLDDSPSKSYSPIKQCSSFSQDSLDGTRRNQKTPNDINSEKASSETTDSLLEGERSYNSNSEDSSAVTESKTYKFQSSIEEEFSLVNNNENENKFFNSLSTISEREKTSEDQKKNTFVEKYDLSNYIDPRIISKSENRNYNPFNENNMETDKNFTENLEDSSLNSESKNSKLFPHSKNDLLHFTPENQNYTDLLSKNFNKEANKTNFENYFNNNTNDSSDNFGNNDKTIFENDRIDQKQIVADKDNTPNLLDQYNLDRYLIDDPIPNEPDLNKFFVSCSSISIYNEFLNSNTMPNINSDDRVLLDKIAARSIVSTEQQITDGTSFKKEKCICVDNAIIGKSCLKCSTQLPDQTKHNEFDSTVSTVYSSINTQASGLDYDLTDMGVTNQLFHEMQNRHLPRIKILTDITRSVEDSSETESSLSGSDNTSYLRYECNSVHLPHRGRSWVSSPELTVARSEMISKKHRRRHLQSENPLKPLCNVCYKPAYFMERISINNIIFHKMCFLCRKCDTHLSFNNCIIHRRKPYCLVHAKSKILKPIRSVSTSKLNQIKERLDSKSNLQKQSSMEAKQQKRVFYGGIKSAKEKFLQDKNAVEEPVVREQKRFTPPRQGVTAGVVESEPKPRDPNIITADDGFNSFNEDLTRLAQTSATKERVARFKELQEKSFDKTIVNGDDIGNQNKEVIGVDTKTIRNKFLSGLNGTDSESKPKKLNPSEEIQELTRRESNTVYENEPEVRTDVIKSDLNMEEPQITVARNKAKELKERFSNYTPEEKIKTEKFQMEIGEGGVYESQPQQRNDDVIPYKNDKDFILPNNTVKSGLQKIKDLQTLKSQGYQKPTNEPIKLDIDTNNCGIFENQPAESQADSISVQNGEYLSNIPDKKYANEAKKAFLDRQKQEEESRVKRDTPQMIDIWKDLCEDSGVFENKPKLQDKDVLRHDDKINEELFVENELAENKSSEVNSEENR